MRVNLSTALHRAAAWLALARLNRAQGRSTRLELVAAMAALRDHRTGRVA